MGVPVAVLSSRSIIDWRRDRKDVVVAESHGRVEGGGRLSLVRSATTQPAERHLALIIGNGQYYYGLQLATLMCDVRLITETRKGMGCMLVGGQVQLDLEKITCDRMVQGFDNLICSYPDSISSRHY
jgi:hypothetical protein